MFVQYIPKKAAAGATITWSQQWRFNVADKELTAGVLGTADGIDVGAPTLTESDGNMQIVSNKLSITGQTTPALWALKLQDLTGITQVFATGAFAKGVTGATKDIHVGLSYSTNGLRVRSYNIEIATSIIEVDHTSGGRFLGSFTGTYDVAVVAGGYNTSKVPYVSGDTKANYRNGCLGFIKGGAFTDWTLVTVGINSVIVLQSNFYGGIEVWDKNSDVDGFGIPDPSSHTYDAIMDLGYCDLFTEGSPPVALSSHTMDVGSGTWSNTNFDVVTGNVAECSTAGETTFDCSESDPIITCAVTIHATKTDTGGIVYRYTDSSNYWYVEVDSGSNLLSIIENNTGTPTTRASTSYTFNASTTYHLTINVYGDSMQTVAVNGSHALSYSTTNTFNETVTNVGLKDTATVNLQFDGFRVWPRTNAAYASNFNTPISELA